MAINSMDDLNKLLKQAAAEENKIRAIPWIIMDKKTSFVYGEPLIPPIPGMGPMLVDSTGAHHNSWPDDNKFYYNKKTFYDMKPVGIFSRNKPMPVKIFWVNNNKDFRKAVIKTFVRAKSRKTNKELFSFRPEIHYTFDNYNSENLYTFLQKFVKTMTPGQTLLTLGDLVDLTAAFMGYTLGDMYEDKYLVDTDFWGGYHIPTATEASKDKRKDFQRKCLIEVTSKQLFSNLGIGLLKSEINLNFD